MGDDCPIFDGLFEYCSISAGGSMGQYHRHCQVMMRAGPDDQRAQRDCRAINVISQSIGLVGYIMPKRQKRVVSAM